MFKALISDAHNRLRIYREKMQGHRNGVLRKTNTIDAESLDAAIKLTTKGFQTRRHNELQQKLKTSRSYKQHHSNTDAWVKNISTRPLTEEETLVLAKGLNYNTTDASKLDYIAELESTLKHTGLNEEIKERIRHKVTTNLLNQKHPVDLTKQEREALKNLKNDDSIVILPADKGRMTVIMNKTDYIDKANSLLSDTSTYQPLNSDPSKTTVNRINKILKPLKNQEKLNEATYNRIRPNDTTTAKFYGLPKVHKENTPLRPIVSLPGSPTYDLSRYLAGILKPLVKTSPHSINNANTFLTKIKNLKLEPDEVMISFDVVSLFTSIPLNEAKRITEQLLTNDDSWQTKTGLHKNDILELLDLCLSTEFTFQNNFYRQVSGTPMGSPLSSFLAEAVMQDLEKRAVTNNKDIITWNRYVDDVFATVKKDKTDDILHTINNTTENIKFTMEEEQKNELAFLDILLTKTNDGTLNTRVYRKQTHTDQILNYNSNHPTQHKISCIKTLFNRIDTHCNTEHAKLEERNHLYSTFMKNQYPKNFINKVLTNMRNTRNQPTSNNTNQQTEDRLRISLPYINSTSEMTARLLRPFNIDVAHKPAHKLKSNFTKHKDKTTTTQTRNAIYMFPCHTCTQKYIGQTSKKIETRLTEHKNAINRYDLKSLPAAHVYENGHTFDWSLTQLLGQAQTKHAREFKEAWHSIDHNTINRHIDIPTVYLQLKHPLNISNPPSYQPPVIPSNTHRNPKNSSAINKNSMPLATHPVTANQTPTLNERPIRRSHRLQLQRENLNHQ